MRSEGHALREEVIVCTLLNLSCIRDTNNNGAKGGPKGPILEKFCAAKGHRFLEALWVTSDRAPFQV